MRVLFKVGNRLEGGDETHDEADEEVQSDDSQNDL